MTKMTVKHWGEPMFEWECTLEEVRLLEANFCNDALESDKSPDLLARSLAVHLPDLLDKPASRELAMAGTIYYLMWLDMTGKPGKIRDYVLVYNMTFDVKPSASGVVVDIGGESETAQN